MAKYEVKKNRVQNYFMENDVILHNDVTLHNPVTCWQASLVFM
jgi:hypothetical protein